VTFDDAENAFLERVFLSDAMPVVGEYVEMIGVHGATAIASKLDAYSTRSMTYVVTVDPSTGTVDGEMDIVITNAVPPDAGGYVLGDRVEESATTAPNGEPLALGDNLLAVSVYSRSTIDAITSPDGDLETFETEPALGYDRNIMVLAVPKGTEKHITFTTHSVVGPHRYDLLVLAQQTANIGELTLVIKPTPGWRVVGDDTAADGSWTSTTPLDLSRGFTFLFERTG
jgi:hypothetical protein